jgi:hypothetical protein
MKYSKLLNGKRSERPSRTEFRPWLMVGFCLALMGTLAGCSSKRYAKRADKEAYRIIAQKEAAIFGRTNAFTIDTKYSSIDPYELKAQQIISERLETGDKLLTLPDALEIAVQNSREYQLNKEGLDAEHQTSCVWAQFPRRGQGDCGARQCGRAEWRLGYELGRHPAIADRGTANGYFGQWVIPLFHGCSPEVGHQ